MLIPTAKTNITEGDENMTFCNHLVVTPTRYPTACAAVASSAAAAPQPAAAAAPRPAALAFALPVAVPARRSREHLEELQARSTQAQRHRKVRLTAAARQAEEEQGWTQWCWPVPGAPLSTWPLPPSGMQCAAPIPSF